MMIFSQCNKPPTTWRSRWSEHQWCRDIKAMLGGRMLSVQSITSLSLIITSLPVCLLAGFSRFEWNLNGGCASARNKPYKLLALIRIKAQIQEDFFFNVAFKVPFSGNNLFYLILESALLNQSGLSGFVIGMRSTERYCSWACYDTFVVVVFVNVKLSKQKSQTMSTLH